MSERELWTRIESLERSNRRMKRVGALGLAFVGALGLLSMAAPALCKTVKAERFVLTDGSGNERVRFDAYSSENPKITIRDRSGQPVADVTLGIDGAFDFALFRDGGPPAKAQLVIDDDGTPRFQGQSDAKSDCKQKSECKREKSIN